MADHKIGKIFVELDLDASRYTKGQQQLLRDATTTTLNIEQNFKNLGIKSSAEMDLMRQKIHNSYNMIANSAKATANDIVRAEEAKNAKLKALNDAQYGAHVSMTDKIKGNWAQIGIAIGAAMAAFALAGRAIGSIKQSVDAMDKLGESSQKIGMSVESLQVWQMAAKQGGVEAESLEKSIGKLAKNAYNLKDTFDELGVAATGPDGLKTIDELLPEIADKFAGMEDGTRKTALAMELFGKSGAELIPVLNKGSQGLEELRQQMGYIATTADAQRADQFNDTLDVMHRRSEGMKMALMSGMLPAMQQLVESFGSGANAGQNLKDIGEGIGNVFKFAAGAAYSLVAGVQLVTVKIAALADRAKIRWDAVTGNTEGIGDRMRASKGGQLAAETEIMQSYFTRMEKLNAQATSISLRRRGGGGAPKPDKEKGGADQETEAMEAWLLKAKEMDPFLDEFKKKKEALEAEAAKLTRKFGEQKWITEGLTTALKNLDLQKLKKDLEEAYKPAEDLADIERVWADALEERNQALNKETLDRYKKSITDISEVADHSMDTIKDFASLWEQRMSSMADAITEFCKTGKFEFTDMVNSMIADVMKLFYKQAMFGKGDQGGGLFEKALGWIGGMFGSPGVNDMTQGWGVNGIDAAVAMGPAFHGGGVVGYDSPSFYRPVPASLFHGAPRFHSGLYSDEFPAILQKGETVIPKGGAAAPVNVIINNNNGSNVTQTSRPNGNGGMDIEVMIDTAVAKQLSTYGSQSNKAMRNNYGTQQTLISR